MNIVIDYVRKYECNEVILIHNKTETPIPRYIFDYESDINGIKVLSFHYNQKSKNLILHI